LKAAGRKARGFESLPFRFTRTLPSTRDYALDDGSNPQVVPSVFGLITRRDAPTVAGELVRYSHGASHSRCGQT
jgi:hypothetical protein